MTGNNGYQINGATIQIVAHINDDDADALATVDWDASNGVSLAISKDYLDSGWIIGSSPFDPSLASFTVQESIHVEGGASRVKVDHNFGMKNPVPEPTTGMLMMLALGGLVALPGRGRA